MCQNSFRILISEKYPRPITWQLSTHSSEFKRDPGPQHVSIYRYLGQVDQYVDEMQNCTPTKKKKTCCVFCRVSLVSKQFSPTLQLSHFFPDKTRHSTPCTNSSADMFIFTPVHLCLPPAPATQSLIVNFMILLFKGNVWYLILQPL
jgi:hypothetical protein